MKTRTQIKTDRFLGVFIAVLLNWLVRLLGKILRIDHTLNKNFKTIAVCKFKGMGSIVQATPLLQSLRRSFPDSTIVFVTTTANLQLLSKIPCIDRVVAINDTSFFRLAGSSTKALFALWKLHISVYLDLEIYSNFSSLITTLSLARHRAGFYRQASHYRMGIYTHMMYYNIKAPISQVYLQFAHLLNCGQITESLYPLAVEPDNAFFNGLNLRDTKYLVVNPNASDLRIERRWQKENFIQLIASIRTRFPQLSVVLIGAPAESQHVADISAAFAADTKVVDVAGKTQLDDLLCLLHHAELLITNDTGPMHLAFALKTTTLALFGPCSPAQYGTHANCFTVYNNVYCSPCVHEFDIPPCKGNNQCMQTISVAQVYALLSAALNHQQPEQHPNDAIVYSGINHEVLGVAYRG